jgi:hypothetical protein
MFLRGSQVLRVSSSNGISFAERCEGVPVEIREGEPSTLPSTTPAPSGHCYRIAKTCWRNNNDSSSDHGRTVGLRPYIQPNSTMRNTLETPTRNGLPRQYREREWNEQSSRKQPAEVEKPHAPHGFVGICGVSEGYEQPVRNVTGLPKD